MKITINELEKDKCTGCSSCFNACRFQAITMKEGKDGFVYPNINVDVCTECGMCVKACPVLTVPKKNTSSPALFAVRASDKIRSTSSSGGMFTVLAKEIISRGGSVCGAAFDDSISLKHTVVDSAKALEPLRGSKYVQSNIGMIYREVEKLLNAGKPVLFTGTPCQAAGLRSYLRKDYDNLYIMDVLCHGVPSQKLFHQYLHEISKEKKVKNVRFRDKRFGWTAEHIIIDYEDGSSYTSDNKNDPYLIGFFRNIILRESCGECPFSEFPRQGDISVGDFWGISSIDKSQSDGKGTSLVYVNTSKGKSLLNAVADGLLMKEYDFQTTAINNRIHAHYVINANRYRLFRFMENNRFSYSISLRKALSRRFDIGLVSNYYAGNFGGSLTQYALYHTLEDMGYSCLMVERPSEAPDKASIETVKRIYKEIPYPLAALAKQRKTKEEMRELNRLCDMFIVGSDQLFQYTLYKNLGKFVTLDWVSDRKKKIAYAASFGHDYIWGDDEELAIMGYYMRKFDAFSVREKSGMEISSNEFGVTAEWVLDPVFLCNPHHYDDLIQKSEHKFPKHYIGTYILDPTKEKADIIKKVQKHLGLKAKVVSELSHNPEYEAPLSGLDVEHLKIEERLQLIKQCDFFVTDSFHGTCFALIMGKPFISILNSNRGGSRFDSLLSLFGLKNHLISSISDLEDNCGVFDKIDFLKVNDILDRERKRCLNWLKKAITTNKKSTYTDYDVLLKMINEQQIEITELKKKIELLSDGEILTFRRTQDVPGYLQALINNKNHYIFVIAVKDTPGLSITQDISKMMQELGISTDLTDKHWMSYATVIDCGNVVVEKLSKDKISTDMKIEGITLSVESANLKAGNVSQIVVNGKEQSVNKRGLNVVVINKVTNNVVDSVCLDMHLKHYQIYRK